MLPSVLPNETDHVPVLADEVLANLAPRPGETIVDGTFGAGGHAGLLTAQLRGDGKLIAIDRDPTVAPYFERLRRSTAAKARLLHGEFSQVLEQLASNGVQADVILLDLGVSSMQLDRPDRGFSYAVDAPLDMRMDPSGGLTASDVVNESGDQELADIFHRYGEERYARQISRAIVGGGQQRFAHRRPRRDDQASIPAPPAGEGHPAKRVFQALRIEVNDELAPRARTAPRSRCCAGRPGRGHLLPLARGPDRQALPSLTGARLHVPARLPDLRVWRAADRARDAQAGDPPLRCRGRTQPAFAVGAPPRGGEALVAPPAHAATVVAPSRTRPRTKPVSRPKTRARRRARSRGAILWIAVSASCLRGRLRQLLVLQMNLAVDKATQERTQLRATTRSCSRTVSGARLAEIRRRLAAWTGSCPPIRPRSATSTSPPRHGGLAREAGEPPHPAAARPVHARVRRAARARLLDPGRAGSPPSEARSGPAPEADHDARGSRHDLRPKRHPARDRRPDDDRLRRPTADRERERARNRRSQGVWGRLELALPGAPEQEEPVRLREALCRSGAGCGISEEGFFGSLVIPGREARVSAGWRRFAVDRLCRGRQPRSRRAGVRVQPQARRPFRQADRRARCDRAGDQRDQLVARAGGRRRLHHDRPHDPGERRASAAGDGVEVGRAIGNSRSCSTDDWRGARDGASSGVQRQRHGERRSGTDTKSRRHRHLRARLDVQARHGHGRALRRS